MTKTILPDPRQFPRFAGVPTFCRYPLLQLVDPDALPLDWALYGVPFDSGVTYRPGARFGPRAIRDASQYVKRYSIEHDLDLCDELSLADAGDAPVSPYDCRENAERVTQFAAALPDPDHTKLLAVGGDHSIAYANIKAAWLRRGKPEAGLALVHFDSHLDTVDSVWGERWGHASPFIRAIEEGLVDPTRMVSIGIKGPLNSKADLDYARDRGVQMITHAQWQADGPAQLSTFLAKLADAPAYLTFDIDCVDPAYAPGTGTLCPGGFTSAEVLTILRSLAGINLVGADVVEVLPDRDPAGITAFLAAHVMFETLCLGALRARRDH